MSIAGLVGAVISGLLVLWKIIRRFQKSSCSVKLEDGTTIDLDFNDLENSIKKEVDEFKGTVSKEDKEKLKKLASFVLKKQKEKIKSPKVSSPTKKPESKVINL